MRKVLITGIDSFTGVHLSKHLKDAGYDIYGTSMLEAGNNRFKCNITNKDNISEVLKVVNPDFLIHLSGISFTAHGSSEDFYRVNTIGAINILDSCVNLGLRPSKILLASSATIYGDQNLEVLDESLCPKPSSHYGASKYAMECLARNYFDKLNIIITRPFNYTGVGQAEHFLIPKIVKHFRDKKTIIELGNLDISREFNDIGYICDIYHRLLECDNVSETVNICSGRGIRLLDVIEMTNEIAGYSIKVVVNPDFVRQGEIRSLTGSPKRLLEVVGKVKQVDFRQTLREMLEA